MQTLQILTMEAELEAMDSLVDPNDPDNRMVNIEEMVQMEVPPQQQQLPAHITPGSRYEKSLGLLTTRFVALLQKAKDGVLDLKEVKRKVNIVDVYVHFFLCTLKARLNLMPKNTWDCGGAGRLSLNTGGVYEH